MKKLPIILLSIGLIVLVGFLLLRGKGADSGDDETNVRELTLAERPFASLIPKEDGHWLKMIVEKIDRVKEAKSMDYELIYQVPGGVSQGVPGTIPLDGTGRVERDLLLGSESKGKFRYDEGVEEGTLTLRFRNGNGKLIGKISGEFHLQNKSRELTSNDGKFKYVLDKEPEDVFFLTMNTFGLPSDLDNIEAGPFGVFPSIREDFPGIVTLSGNIKRFEGEWKDAESGKSPKIGVFVGVK